MVHMISTENWTIYPVLAGAAVVANPAKLGPFFERLYQARNSLRELRFSATASTCSQILVDRWMHDLSQEIDPPLPGVPAKNLLSYLATIKEPLVAPG